MPLATYYVPRMWMRAGLLLVLLLVVVCLRPDVAVASRWVVNEYGNCVKEWTPSSIARGPLAMVNAFTFPVRQLVGGGQVGYEDSARSPLARAFLTPTLALLGLGTGTIELVYVTTQGLADFVTGGAFDLVPDETADVALTPMTPRFLEGPKPTPATDPCGRPAR
jgi:hypothetical protein